LSFEATASFNKDAFTAPLHWEGMAKQHASLGDSYNKKGSVLTGVYGKKKRPSTSFDFLFSRAKLARAAQ
jgi:hypothetical protein